MSCAPEELEKAPGLPELKSPRGGGGRVRAKRTCDAVRCADLGASETSGWIDGPRVRFPLGRGVLPATLHGIFTRGPNVRRDTAPRSKQKQIAVTFRAREPGRFLVLNSQRVSSGGRLPSAAEGLRRHPVGALLCSRGSPSREQPFFARLQSIGGSPRIPARLSELRSN